MGRRRHQCPSVLPSKSKKKPYWYFRAYIDVRKIIDGKPVEKRVEGPRRFLGYCDEIGIKQARQRRDEILVAVINKPQVVITSQVLFSEVLAIYKRDYLSALREHTKATVESSLKQHFEPTLGKLRMCDIDTLAIQRWVSAMPGAHSSKKRRFDLLKSIWEQAEEWGFTQQRFPAKAKRIQFGPLRRVKGQEMPTMDQIRRLLANMEDPYRAMAEIALFTGLRISEILGLQWGDVEAGRLTVRRRLAQKGPVDAPKTQKGLRVLDARPIQSVLERLLRDTSMNSSGRATGRKSEVRCASPRVDVAGDFQQVPAGPGRPGARRPSARSTISDGLPYIGVNGRENDDAVQEGGDCRRTAGALLGNGSSSPSEWIFNRRGLGYRTCEERIKAAAELAGIKIARFGFHHLRAICNTLAKQQGMDSSDRQAIMGHAGEKVNALYLMVSDEDVQRRGEAMMRVQSFILGPTKGVQ